MPRRPALPRFSLSLLLCAATSPAGALSPALRFKSGQSWDSLETSQVIETASGRLLEEKQSRLRFKVEWTSRDGAALLEAASRGERVGYFLVTGEGWIYALDGFQAQELRASAEPASWLRSKGLAAVDWYKLPSAPLDVGMSEQRLLGSQRWQVTRLKDETLAGTACEVYRARLAGSPAEMVAETAWVDPQSGSVRKKEFVSRGRGRARRLLLERLAGS